MVSVYTEEKAYISRLREVETKVQMLTKKKRMYEKEINYLRIPYVTPQPPRKPVINMLEIIEEAVLVLCIIGILLICALFAGKTGVVLGIGVVIFLGYLGYVFLRTNKERLRYKGELAEYKVICEKNEQRLKADKLVVEARLKEIDTISKELEKLLSEREWLYVESYIPERCRNVRCIYCIYDMVVNEKLSLEAAVRYAGEDGFEALVEKYDEAVQTECMRLMKVL